MKEKTFVRLLKIFVAVIIVGTLYVIYYNVVTYTGEIELYINLISYFTKASAGIGLICCAKVALGIFNMIREHKLTEIQNIEKELNIEIPQKLINDIENGTATDEPGQYRDMIMLIAITTTFVICSNHGKSTVSFVICFVCALLLILEIVNYCAVFIKQINTASIFHQKKMLGITSLPLAWFEFQILFTRENWVMYIYRGIIQSENSEIKILMISLIVGYILITLICHYIYIYSFIGLLSQKIRIEEVNKRLERFMIYELQNHGNGNKGNGKYQVIKICLFFRNYLKERVHAVRYLLMLLEKKALGTLAGLMGVGHFKKNICRFCKIVIVSELIILDFILATNLNSDNPCLVFFDLISTLVIIPVAISSFPGKR